LILSPFAPSCSFLPFLLFYVRSASIFVYLLHPEITFLFFSFFFFFLFFFYCCFARSSLPFSLSLFLSRSHSVLLYVLCMLLFYIKLKLFLCATFFVVFLPPRTLVGVPLSLPIILFFPWCKLGHDCVFVILLLVIIVLNYYWFITLFLLTICYLKESIRKYYYYDYIFGPLCFGVLLLISLSTFQKKNIYAVLSLSLSFSLLHSPVCLSGDLIILWFIILKKKSLFTQNHHYFVVVLLLFPALFCMEEILFRKEIVFRVGIDSNSLFLSLSLSHSLSFFLSFLLTLWLL
jgi:hypothetical protein